MNRRDFVKSMLMAGVAPAVLTGRTIGGTAPVPIDFDDLTNVADYYDGAEITINRMLGWEVEESNWSASQELTRGEVRTFMVKYADGTKNYFTGMVQRVTTMISPDQPHCEEIVLKCQNKNIRSDHVVDVDGVTAIVVDSGREKFNWDREES